MLKKYQLKNGLKVLAIQSKKSPVVSVQMWVKTGSADEQKKVQGISHFIEHLVFKGTEKFSLGQIAATVEGSGGELNAYTTFDQTVFYVTISKNYATTGFDVIAQMMGFPKFAKEDIDSEREVVIEEIKRGNDNVHRQASRLLFETLYKTHPYGKPVIGYESVIRKVSQKQILDYYHSRYVPKNMTLVVAGDFEFVALKQQLDFYFEPFKGYKLKKVSRTKEAAQRSPRIAIKKTQFQENVLYLSWPVPAAPHKDVPALDVLAMIFGQGESSRINQCLRLQEPLVNDVGSSTFTPLNPGFFTISASLSPENFERVLNKTGDEILKLRQEAVLAAEIEKAQTNLASEEAYSLETVDGLARKVGTYNLFFNEPEYQKKFLKAVLKVNAKEVASVVDKYLNPKVLSLVMLTNADEISLRAIANRWLKSFQKQWLASKKFRSLRPLKIKKINLQAGRLVRGSTEILREVLPSGVVLLLRSNTDVPVFSLRCGFLGGMRCEDMSHSGLTEMMTRSWVSGTKQISEAELYHRIESLASSLSAFGGRNTIGLQMTTLSAFTEPMLDLFEQVLLEPTFSAEVIHREKITQLEALRTRQDNTAQLAILRFMQLLFAGHPYSIDPLGSKNSIEKMSTNQFQQFLKKHLQQQNCVVSVSGAFGNRDQIERLKKIFSQLPMGERYRDPRQFVVPKQNQQSFQEIKKEQTHLVIGYPGLSLTDPQRYALHVAQSVLAGQGGRLFYELRDKASLAYSVSPLRMDGTDCGYFGAYIGCSPEKAQTALRMLREEFQKIASVKIFDVELDRAKKYLIGRHDIELQRNSAICSSLLFDEIYGLPYDETFRFAEKINAVTSSDVLTIAQRIFSQNEVISVVGPISPFT